MKSLTTLFLFCVINLISYSQETNLTMTISPENSITSDKLTFHCTINNYTEKSLKVIPFSWDCDDKLYPRFWKITIEKDSVEYDFDPDSSIIVLGQPSFSELVKIRPESKYSFSFCIDFSKLVIIDRSSNSETQYNFTKDKKNDKINSDFGTYSIRLEYTSTLKIKRQARHFASDKVSIIYKK